MMSLCLFQGIRASINQYYHENVFLKVIFIGRRCCKLALLSKLGCSNGLILALGRLVNLPLHPLAVSSTSNLFLICCDGMGSKQVKVVLGKARLG
jgi:hypothetical protein